ncbi:MAG: histidine kinase dimerization/phospho-acceptor domain-containing protein, partial [Nitrososphaeraceae archaeon]
RQNDKMQREFINIAADELTIPVHPILGLSEMALRESESIQQRGVICADVIFRNARKLQLLSEDILEVSKIESDFLSLNKSDFN